MSKELELYKAFIDGLVERKDSMTALWVKGDGFPKTEDNKAKNELLAALTPEQKGVLAEMLQDEHIAGIHDTFLTGPFEKGRATPEDAPRPPVDAQRKVANEDTHTFLFGSDNQADLHLSTTAK